MEREKGQERQKKEENHRWKSNYRQRTSVRGLFSPSCLQEVVWSPTDGRIHRTTFYCIFPRPIKSPNSAYLRLCVGTRDCYSSSHLIATCESRWARDPHGWGTAGDECLQSLSCWLEAVLMFVWCVSVRLVPIFTMSSHFSLRGCVCGALLIKHTHLMQQPIGKARNTP